MIEKISLNALKFFYYVATHGSVTQASTKLFVTQSAVSKQIKNLEESLDMALFDRVGKNLVLTPDGAVLFGCCQLVFSRLDDCLSELKSQQNQQKQLVLSCEPTISMKWLIPRLAQFNQLNYGFEIVLLTAGGAVDFDGQAIDIALRRNDFEWGADIYHEKIADEYIVAVRNPHIAENKTLLLSSSRPNLWRQLSKAQLLQTDMRDYEQIRLEHFYLCIEGCLAGLGTAVVSIYMVEKELDNHFLQCVHSPVADGSAYHLLSAKPFYQDKRKVLFKDWLKQEMQKSEMGFLSG